MPHPAAKLRVLLPATVCLAFAAAGALRADEATLRDGSTTSGLVVTGLDATTVHLQGQPALPRAKLAAITRDAYTLPAMPGAVTLKDGTHLGGAIRSFKSGVLTFRSVTLSGQVELPLAALAAIRYRALPPGLAWPDGPDAGAAATVLCRDGSRVSGQLMWADKESVGILGAGGLQRLPAADLVGVVLAPIPAPAALRLRNGDAFDAWQPEAGGGLSLSVATTTAKVPFAAVKQLIFTPATKE